MAHDNNFLIDYNEMLREAIVSLHKMHMRLKGVSSQSSDGQEIVYQIGQLQKYVDELRELAAMQNGWPSVRIQPDPQAGWHGYREY